MLSVFLFNFQARHYKESLFCFSRLKMRPMSWMKCICSLFNCFQVWQSLPSDIHMASLTYLLKCHFFQGRLSLFITASPLLPGFLLLFYVSSGHLLLYCTICSFIYQMSPPKNVSSMRTETLSPLFTALSPHWEKCLEQRRCSLNVQGRHE